MSPPSFKCSFTERKIQRTITVENFYNERHKIFGLFSKGDLKCWYTAVVSAIKEAETLGALEPLSLKLMLLFASASRIVAFARMLRYFFPCFPPKIQNSIVFQIPSIGTQ